MEERIFQARDTSKRLPVMTQRRAVVNLPVTSKTHQVELVFLKATSTLLCTKHAYSRLDTENVGSWVKYTINFSPSHLKTKQGIDLNLGQGKYFSPFPRAILHLLHEQLHQTITTLLIDATVNS